MPEMSEDGKGRTLWQIITGQNKKILTPVEFQYHNPIKAKVGVSVSFTHDMEFSGLNFFVDKIYVYKTEVGKKTFYSTDYSLRAVTLTSGPIRLRLRAIPNDNVESGFEFRLYRLYHEMSYDKEFYENVLGDASGEFHVNQDDSGNELTEPWKYWRKNDAVDAYLAEVTTMSDLNKDGKVDENELSHNTVYYWDYSRMTTDDVTKQEYEEFLDIEMDDETKYFTFLRGKSIESFQVSVI